MTPVQTREETGTEAACMGAYEKARRKRQMQAALDRGDTDAYMHERLALGFASSDQERGARYVVPVEPPRTTPRPPRQRRDRRLNGGRPRGRRVASRSAGGGSSGDSDPDLDRPPSEAAAP